MDKYIDRINTLLRNNYTELARAVRCVRALINGEEAPMDMTEDDRRTCPAEEMEMHRHSTKDANDSAPDSGVLLGKLAAATRCTPDALTAGPGAECFTMTLPEAEQVLAFLTALQGGALSPCGAAYGNRLHKVVRSIAQGLATPWRPDSGPPTEHVGAAPVPPAAKRPWQCPPGWKIGADYPDKDAVEARRDARARSPLTLAECAALERRIDEDAAEAAVGDDEQE